MFSAKFIVTLLFFTGINCITNYCKICADHVLCKYNVSGPGEQCRGYDKDAAALSRNEIKTIVDKINERRCFVAQGMSQNLALPQAGNMRTVSWSDELATLAQRWADQCDPTLNREKPDQCRNLVNTSVGQNIASVSGSTPGLNVKSFVELWFMQSLAYAGSVCYYNSSKDRNSDYFTQLIWAETHTVGCGKAKFYIAGGKIPLARLVCNFAPSGNIHGRPVYMIGFPATQCPLGTYPDATYVGLCSSTTNISARLPTTQSTSVSSLLRILNLFNDSVTQEIDPIRIDTKQQGVKVNKADDRRNQKTRHIYNRTNNADNAFEVPMMGNLWSPNMDMSRRHEHPMKFDRGHSRINHGHDYTTTPAVPSIDNYRRHNQQECTRKRGECNECTTNNCVTNDCATTCATNACQINRCTRGRTSSCYEPCAKSACNTHEQHYQPTFPTARCNFDVTCECLPKNPCQQTTRCPNHFPRQNDNSKAPVTYANKNSQDFQYYDLFPNVALRRGDGPNNSSFKGETWLVKYNMGFTPKTMYFALKNQNRKKVSDTFVNSEKSRDEGEYQYDNSYQSRKKKRKAKNDTSFKPFWQMELYHSKPKRKALRYTTLSGRKYFEHSDQILGGNKHDNTSREPDHEHQVKEKFLSFDELMNLRRNSANKQLNSRRSNKPTHKKKPEARRDDKDKNLNNNPETPTTKPATQPPTETFPRIRHCTRQLTCTWTAPTILGEDGSPRPAGDSGGRGSRTPPGYVEGCTRTSTCTRDYMQRNKLASSDQLEGSGTEPAEDEDYCERRSLNVKRRDSDDAHYSFKRFTGEPTSTLPNTIIDYQNTYASLMNEDSHGFHDEGCVCKTSSTKIKRSVGHVKMITYQDLYYKVLSEILESWKDKLSSPLRSNVCNKSQTFSPNTKLISVIIVINLLVNILIPYLNYL